MIIALYFKTLFFFFGRPNLESCVGSLLLVKNSEGPIYNNRSCLFNSLNIMLKHLPSNISGLCGIPPKLSSATLAE